MANSGVLESTVTCNVAKIVGGEIHIETSCTRGLADVPVSVIQSCGYCLKSLHCYMVETSSWQ